MAIDFVGVFVGSCEKIGVLVDLLRLEIGYFCDSNFVHSYTVIFWCFLVFGAEVLNLLVFHGILTVCGKVG